MGDVLETVTFLNMPSKREEIERLKFNGLIKKTIALGVRDALANTNLDAEAYWDLEDIFGITKERLKDLAKGTAEGITIEEIMMLSLGLDMMLEVNFKPS